MKTNIFKKLLLRQEVVSLGHVLFPCLLSALLPLAIRNSDCLFQFFSKMNTDTIGIHTFIFHVLGWFRGGSSPSVKRELSKKMVNWALLISVISLIHLVLFIKNGQIDLTAILDIALMANGYLNGIVASDNLLATTSSHNR